MENKPPKFVRGNIISSVGVGPGEGVKHVKILYTFIQTGVED